MLTNAESGTFQTILFGLIIIDEFTQLLFTRTINENYAVQSQKTKK